jgi:hypothetical protein
MKPNTEARDHDPVRVIEEQSPFRDAFARARLESFGTGAMTEVKATRRRKGGHTRSDKHASARPPIFEVRIERRSGKRSVDARRWNLLGRDGWELVAVKRKHAFFRRALQ